VQIVYKEANLANFDLVSKFNIATAISVNASIQLTPDKQDKFELVATEISELAHSNEDYPLQPKKHSFEFLREIAHLRPRSNTFNAVFKIRSLASFAIHAFFNEHDFTYVNTPIISGSDAEGAGEMFAVTTLDLKDIPKTANGEINFNEDFFKKETSLTVSGQLQAEAFALAFKNVYTFGPTFRAENSHTTRHASEF